MTEIDYPRQLYDPIWNSALGTDATLLIAEGYPTISLRILDKTHGTMIDEGGVGILTSRAVAAVRAAELVEKNVQQKDLNGAFLTFNGRTWKVVGKYPRPSPQGEDAGQVWLVLTRHDHD